MTVEEMQELIRRATEMHENSWQQGASSTGVQTGFGHYTVSTDEAVLAVCHNMNLDERFVLPISILIETGYCEVDDWANNRVDEPMPEIDDGMIVKAI